MMKMFLKIVLLLFLESIFLSGVLGYSPERAGFTVLFKNQINPYKVMSIFVLPKQELSLEVLEDINNNYKFIFDKARLTAISGKKWKCEVPEQVGLYSAKVIKLGTSQEMMFNIFVMVPYDKLQGEYLDGYRIGKYPSFPLKNILPRYKPPEGFIKVTEVNKDIFLSPHLKLSQFLCKQISGYPKYIVLQEILLLKLELILEKLNESGYQCNTFYILSGYRTPYYNKKIGNVAYSRHIWGGAADIFIDENPKDGYMDDLNKDGIINYNDAQVIYDFIDSMYGKPWYELFIGGLGHYKKTSSHGPFVHVDVRGKRARWRG